MSATPEHPSPERSISYTGIGVAIGAGAGLVVGVLIGGPAIALSVAVGAGVGVAIGSAIDGHRPATPPG